MKPKTVRVHDKMQRGYTYDVVALPGRDFAKGFEPELTPAEMLRLGVFGGKYDRLWPRVSKELVCTGQTVSQAP